MPHLCPRPCSRLATAAIFVSVGVVQFVIGVIFLRSKYVYLLAGPDFWTSASNISVGCLLGVAASVWKNSRKRRLSKKYFLRRNLLLALLISVLVMNATTLWILLLGEGNTLLSIRLENGTNFDKATLASEILAYAYVTSVCCPIVCIVVTIVSMSGSLFKYAAVKENLKQNQEAKTVVNTSTDERFRRPLRWIYTPELYESSRKKIRELILTSSSESDEDAKDISSYHKYPDSAEDIKHVLSRMAQGKRDSILSDSAIMLREMDLRRKNKYDSFDRDGSYVGPMLQRARESVLGKSRPKEDYIKLNEMTQTSIKRPQRDCPDFNGNSYLPPDDFSIKRIRFAKSKELGTFCIKPHQSKELVNEYQTASSKLAKHYPSQYKKFREKYRSSSDISDRAIRDFAGIRKNPRISEVELELRDLPSEYKDQIKWKSSEKMQENEGSKRFEETSPSDCLSPDGSDFESDSIFEKSRRSSWAGEIVPISTKHKSGLKLSRKLIPVENPVVPPLRKMHDAPKISEDSGIVCAELNNFNDMANSDSKNRKSISSFQDDLVTRSKDNAQEYPKMGSQSMKKYDINNVVKMASISEEPNVEINNGSERSDNSEDDIDLSSWKSYSGRNSLLHESEKDRNRDRIKLRRDTTIKRKASVSGKALRKIWSLAMSESKNDFRDQVVDEDSLIGLSEEQLIARQLRTRSIRKVVQQRMREKAEM